MLSSRYPTHTGLGLLNNKRITVWLLLCQAAHSFQFKPPQCQRQGGEGQKNYNSGRSRVQVSRLATLAGVRGCHSAAPPSLELLLPVGWLASELAYIVTTDQTPGRGDFLARLQKKHLSLHASGLKLTVAVLPDTGLPSVASTDTSRNRLKMLPSPQANGALENG